MDFARIDTRHHAEGVASLHLYNPYDETLLFHDGEPILIHMRGAESITGRRAAAKLAQKLDNQKGTKLRASKMEIAEILDYADDREKLRAEFYAELITGWDHIFYIEDSDLDKEDAVAKPLEFSKNNVIKLLTTRHWVAEEVEAFLADKANFAPKSKKSSASGSTTSLGSQQVK